MYQENSPHPNNPRPLPQSHELVGHYFDQLRGQIIGILDRDISSQNTISNLERELAVYKRAYADLDTEKQELQRLKQEAEKQLDDLKAQLQVNGHRVVTLIDGDGAIFNPQFIVQGQVGGHEAASKLTDYITQYFQTNFGMNNYQIWVYVFLNKRGLLDTFGRTGELLARSKLDEFIYGFNQASERFMMVDVGSAKEAADAKIKALLESEIRSHDNGYVTTLRSQITAGFRGKLILLPSYAEIAAGISELDLPVLAVPDLFISEKLGTTNPLANLSVATTAKEHGTLPSNEPITPSRAYGHQPRGSYEASSFTLAELEETSTKPQLAAGVTSTYSSILRTSTRRAPPTPELESGGSTSSDADEITTDPRVSPKLFNARRFNPKLPLSKRT
ncbi:hypothetical protein CC1G_00445 [Coprinopsis cinerea okayama7|uniref:DUF7923 domain-containing protein n=1 Tax=Coprinopsis cinerea (strain Okayama-7 / 130 / ATCC MYA-4618 / FGSC 9003) TaxID=240176 RepID=A8NXZ0_COPC7|nr:hypothetical protein CC1G_00445 [Coprinopsis cinerea okayama7\|eukprot:XP_001837309.2 hypothetical protein CC1G_00445 [Coprinopsis cinerea okayama7\